MKFHRAWVRYNIVMGYVLGINGLLLAWYGDRPWAAVRNLIFSLILLLCARLHESEARKEE